MKSLDGIKTKIVKIDQLYALYNKIEPSYCFYEWIEKLHECGIVTHLETKYSTDYLIFDILAFTE